MRRTAKALVAVTCLAAAACGTATAGPAETGTVRTVLNADPSSFDPAMAQGQQTFQVASLLYDTLLRRDDGSKLVGGLASSWSAESASDYTFTIRDDATCADGTPITASVVAASLTQARRPRSSGRRGRTWCSARAPRLSRPTTRPDRADRAVRAVHHAPPGHGDPAGRHRLPGRHRRPGRARGRHRARRVLRPVHGGGSPAGSELSRSTCAPTTPPGPRSRSRLTGTPPKRIEAGITTDQSTMANQILAGDLDLGQFADPDAVKRFTAQPDLHQYQVIERDLLHRVQPAAGSGLRRPPGPAARRGQGDRPERVQRRVQQEHARRADVGRAGELRVRQHRPLAAGHGTTRRARARSCPAREHHDDRQHREPAVQRRRRLRLPGARRRGRERDHEQGRQRHVLEHDRRGRRRLGPRVPRRPELGRLDQRVARPGHRAGGRGRRAQLQRVEQPGGRGRRWPTGSPPPTRSPGARPSNGRSAACSSAPTSSRWPAAH